MSDLLSLGTSGIQTYQKALSTVSNNIANLNTEGYSRQVAESEETTPKSIGSGYLGTGSATTAIRRQYDAFLEDSLRQSSSNLASQEQLVKYAERLVNLLGSETVGLDNAFDQFFATAKELSADPASNVLRQSYLRDADTVASRFRELAGLMNEVGLESTEEFASNLDELNALASELAQVNKMMLKNASELKQPPQLLDQRDLILRQMADLIPVTVRTNTIGQATVSLTSSFNKGVIVSGVVAERARVDFDDTDPGNIRLIIEKTDGSIDELTGTSNGTLGGIVQFRQTVLDPILSGFDALAKSFADTLNQIQTTGIDGHGDFGQALFQIDPVFDVARDAASLTFDTDIRAEAGFTGLDEPIRVYFDELQNIWKSVDPVTQRPVTQNADGDLKFDGLTVRMTGTARTGDSITITSRDQAALTIQARLEDPLAVATSSVFRISHDEDNLGTSTPRVAYKPLPVRPEEQLIQETFGVTAAQFVSANASTRAQLGLVQAGARDLKAISQSNFDEPVSLHLMTREGVHIAGDPLSDGQLQALVDPVNGFVDDATYVGGYRNQTSQQAYRDLDVFVGLRGEAQTVDLASSPVDPRTGERTSVLSQSQYSGRLESKPLPEVSVAPGEDRTVIPAGALTVNGRAMPGLVAPVGGENLAVGTVVDWFNQTGAGNFVAAASNRTEFELDQIDLSSTLEINGSIVNAVEDGAPDTRGFISMQHLVDSINAESEATGVEASLTDRNSLILERVTDPDQPIELSSGSQFRYRHPFAPQQTTSLRSQIQIESVDPLADLEIRLTDTGTVQHLAALGLNAGIYLDGEAEEDLLLFAVGAGSKNTAFELSGSVDDPLNTQTEIETLRDSQFKLTFLDEETFQIHDLETDTLMGTRQLDAENRTNYRGIELSFDPNPRAGDSFVVDGNNTGPDGEFNAFANNENINRVVELEFDPNAFGTGETIGETYRQLFSLAGNRANQAAVARDALQVVKDQAVGARDAVSGVSLDEEAADLIRFQQAYQASAQVIQAAQTLFDRIISIR